MLKIFEVLDVALRMLDLVFFILNFCAAALCCTEMDSGLVQAALAAAGA